MSLIEQAVKAEQEYQLQMRVMTDRLKHIQGYLGHIYISEEIIGVGRACLLKMIWFI